MREYESIFILRPNLKESDIDIEIGKVVELVEKDRGKVISVDKWGMKKFAYKMKKEREGFYTLIRFSSKSSFIKSFDSNLKLNENILRHIVIKIEGG